MDRERALAGREEFLARIGELRPRLHRYCSRLLASPLDAEDVVQDVLAQAYFKMPILDAGGGLENWLFRVARNRAVDWLRRRAVRERPLEPAPDAVEPRDPVADRQTVDRAFGELVVRLPPKERASLVLKDVLDFSLREAASALDMTEGAVKAALHRARSKLREGDGESALEAPPPRDSDEHRLLAAYADRFNSRDWDGLVALLRADARLEVLEVFEGTGTDGFSRLYFRNYSRLEVEWRTRPVALAGEWVLLVERALEGGWRPYSVVRVGFEEGSIAAVKDYLHAPPYLLASVARALGAPAPAGFDWAHLPGVR